MESPPKPPLMLLSTPPTLGLTWRNSSSGGAEGQGRAAARTDLVPLAQLQAAVERRHSLGEGGGSQRAGVRRLRLVQNVPALGVAVLRLVKGQQKLLRFLFSEVGRVSATDTATGERVSVRRPRVYGSTMNSGSCFSRSLCVRARACVRGGEGSAGRGATTGTGVRRLYRPAVLLGLGLRKSGGIPPPAARALEGSCCIGHKRCSRHAAAGRRRAAAVGPPSGEQRDTAATKCISERIQPGCGRFAPPQASPRRGARGRRRGFFQMEGNRAHHNTVVCTPSPHPSRG